MLALHGVSAQTSVVHRVFLLVCRFDADENWGILASFPPPLPCSSNSLDILHRAWSCCGLPVSCSLAAVCCPFLLCTARCCAPMVHRGPSSGLSGCALLFLDPGGLSPGNFSGWHRPCLSYFPRLSWFIQGPSVRPFGICRFFPFVVFLGFWRPGLYNGLRIGEASNPGPPQSTLHDFFGKRGAAVQREAPSSLSCVFAVVNPTSILHKVPAIMDLGADVVALAETSAVHRAQQVTTTAFRKYGFKVHWGRAVPSHSRVESDTVSMRGLAAGVALATKLPSRRPRPDLPDEVAATCRLSESFVRLGALEIRVITIYGVPLSEPDARERTNALLKKAFERASQNAVPCIVAGDFNVRPFDCPAGQAFRSQGYQDVFDLYHGRTGQELPATCRG